MCGNFFQAVGENNSHNDTVDCDSFAENNADEILCLDPWRMHPSTEDAGTSEEDTPEKEDGRMRRTTTELVGCPLGLCTHVNANRLKKQLRLCPPMPALVGLG